MPHTYTHVQLITYEIATLKPFSTGATKQLDDLMLRVENLYKVMEYCFSQLQNDQDRTLKIFVAPEFYARYHRGQHTGPGHYRWDDVTIAMAHFKGKCKRETNFKHWLIVPGTVIFEELGMRGKENLIFSTIYVFKGDRSVEHIINKQGFSAIDELDDDLSGGKSNLKFNALGATRAEFKTLDVANVRIGFEVCLDHEDGRLRAYITQTTPPEIIDVHVLTACGKRPKSWGISARQNGYFFRCDGHPDLLGSSDLSVTWPHDVVTADDLVTTTPNPGPFQLQNQPLIPDLQINPSDPTARVNIYAIRQL